jgi:fructose-1,6-bisphosphatase/inositol monophosphatase family enzyme
MIRDSAHFDSNAAFETVKIGNREKIAVVVDIVAERLAALELWRRLKRLDPLILGEESLRDEGLDLSEETRLVALLDMVDGSDLLERGLGNWCSAAAFFLPAERQILGAFVAVPEGDIYFWTIETPVPQKFNIKSGRMESIGGPSGVRAVSEASISFYGQKMANFCSCAGELTHERNRNLLARDLATRIYNLAGIPTMMKVVDGSVHKRIDAVFELLGQNPHDAVPGAVIAQAAGATLLGLDGTPLDLLSALLRPSDPSRRLRYVLAATPELASELLECLNDRQSPLDHGQIAA